MPSGGSTDTAATVHLGGSVPSLLLSPSPPSSSSLFIQLLGSSSLPLSSALLLSPPHLALFNHHSLFLIFSQPLQCLAKKEGGAKVRGKSLNAATVLIGGGPEGSGSWGRIFLAQESWVEGSAPHSLTVKTAVEHPPVCELRAILSAWSSGLKAREASDRLSA